MNQMKLPQIINEAVTKPNSQAIVDAGTMISGMILNLLSDAKIRLYRLYHFFEDKPMPLILPWNPKIKPSNFHTITSEIIEIEKTIKRNKRGRLKNGEIPSKERRFLVKFKPCQDVTACNREQENCGLFVLITTLKDMEKYPDREILSQYKGQQAVENIFKFIKDPALVGAYCLKNPEQIVAFGYILLMAAQVYTILERVVRKNLENPDIDRRQKDRQLTEMG